MTVLFEEKRTHFLFNESVSPIIVRKNEKEPLFSDFFLFDAYNKVKATLKRGSITFSLAKSGDAFGLTIFYPQRKPQMAHLTKEDRDRLENISERDCLSATLQRTWTRIQARSPVRFDTKRSVKQKVYTKSCQQVATSNTASADCFYAMSCVACSRSKNVRGL